MNSEIIKIIEEKRNILYREIKRKGILAKKYEKEILKKYDDLLIQYYKKYSP